MTRDNGRDGPPPSGGRGQAGECVRVVAPAEGAPRRARMARSSGRGRPAVRVSLLGTFALTEDGVSRAIPKAARRLVALLALHRRGLSRSRAAALLTPHLEPDSAAGSLRATLARLRATGLHLLAPEEGSLRLADDVSVDAWEQEALAVQLASDAAELPDAIEIDELVVELLPGWDDDWVLFERARLQDLFLHALEAHARRLAAQGTEVAALSAAYEVLRADPLRESAARLLVEMHLAEGNHAQAVRAYLDFRQRVRAALGVEPSGAMRALVAPLLPTSRGA